MMTIEIVLCIKRKEMEFIFQLFAELFNRSENEVAPSKDEVVQPVNNVADYESEVAESPLSELNIFGIVDFH